MDALCRAIGACGTLKIGGRTYVCRPMTLDDYGLVENHIITNRVLPTEVILPRLSGLPASPRRFLISKALEDLGKIPGYVPRDEFWEWMDTARGLELTAWLSLRNEYGDEFRCLEDMSEKFSADRSLYARWARVRDLVSGQDHNALADWPAFANEPDDKKAPKKIPWRKIVGTQMRDGFSKWTPESLGKLTLYQLRMLTCPEAHLGGRIRGKPDEMRRLLDTINTR